MKSGRLILLTILVALSAAAPAAADSGAWVRAWGKDVVQAGFAGDTVLGSREICTVAPGCKVGGATSGLGGEFGQLSGVAVDPISGFVYVADTGADRIQKFSANGSFIRTWGKDVIQGGSADLESCTSPDNCQNAATSTGLGGEMDAPEGIAIDPSGFVYVVERLNQRVTKFDGTGQFQATWGKDVIQEGEPGDTAGDRAEICTVASDCQAGEDDGVQGGEFFNPNGATADSSFLYVSDRAHNRIQKFSFGGTFVRTWGLDVNGANAGTDLESCTSAASCKEGETSTGKGGELHFPVGLAADPSGNIYVADTGGHEVQKFDEFGNWQAAWGNGVLGGTGFQICLVAAICQSGSSATSLGGELNQPTGITASATTVIVSDPYKNRIQEFAPGGAFRGTFGRGVLGGAGFEVCTVPASCQIGDIGALGGELQLPAGLALTPSASLYVADDGNRRMQVFTERPPVTPPAATPPTPVKKKKCKRKKKRRRALVAQKKKCKKKKK